jgi:hypothetical protein
MARGWESKSVEAQIEASHSEPSPGNIDYLSAENIEINRKRSHLRLSRQRVLQQLERSNNERYSELLRQASSDLDVQIAALG